MKPESHRVGERSSKFENSAAYRNEFEGNFETELGTLGDGGLAPEEFKAAFRNHPAGVAVVTADAGQGPVGLTATSVFSVSAEPAILVFSVSESSSSTPTILRSTTVIVHLLGAEQIDLARLCATSGVDRFADPDSWSRLITGEPFFPVAHTWIRGRVINKLEAGSSTLIVVQALQAKAPSPGSREADAAAALPLVYHNRTWHRLSEASKLE